MQKGSLTQPLKLRKPSLHLVVKIWEPDIKAPRTDPVTNPGDKGPVPQTYPATNPEVEEQKDLWSEPKNPTAVRTLFLSVFVSIPWIVHNVNLL